LVQRAFCIDPDFRFSEVGSHPSAEPDTAWSNLVAIDPSLNDACMRGKDKDPYAVFNVAVIGRGSEAEAELIVRIVDDPMGFAIVEFRPGARAVRWIGKQVEAVFPPDLERGFRKEDG